MQILSATKATKTKRLNKRRNLFGLGLTSLIAACSADGAADGGDQSEDALPFKADKANALLKAEKLLEPKDDLAKVEALTEAQGSGYTAEIEKSDDFDDGGTADQLDAKITKSDGTSVFLNFSAGGKSDKNTAGIYQLTDAGKYDLVIASSAIDKAPLSPEYIKGRIFIYWDVAEVAVNQNPTASPHLEIIGHRSGDQIGTHAPEFLQLGGKDGYDMVIRSEWILKTSSDLNTGAIYVLWDVADYAGATTAITLDGSGTNIKDAGLLTIKGAIKGDRIGTHAPEFLQLGGKDGYDMVISSYSVGSDDSSTEATPGNGAIYILWDIDSYSGDKTALITLDGSDTNVNDSGLLTIKGAIKGDRIGNNPPEFLQLDGDGDNKLDMVIRSYSVDSYKGAIYILWDVDSYSGDKTAAITLDGSGTGVNVASGLLTIKGAIEDDQIGIRESEFLQLGGDGYDMVIRSNSVGGYKGAIYILWDVADYAGEKISITLDDSATGVNVASGLLTIKGATVDDQIGIRESEFLQLGGDGYDMVIRSNSVGRNKGAIYILWDVEDYSGGSKTITLDDSATGVNVASGLLTIKGAREDDSIGIHAPEFLQLGGKDGYDMVIKSNETAGNEMPGVGAIFILWDVADYARAATSITLNDAGLASATAGSLAIYGTKVNDNIGIHAPEFLQLDGKDDNYDMVIRSEAVDKVGNSDFTTNEGAIYILWNVEDYYQDASDAILNKRIDLEAVAGADSYATSGLLTIKGVIEDDNIGIYAPEFLQLGKENDKYDLIIQSEQVDKSADSGGANTGAIYVLWDVADYAGGNETINLTSLSSDASSGLLTIYGTADSELGSSDILYRADNKDSDVDGDGTNDLVFKNKDYTYVLFGDQLGAVNADTGKVASKTIDLASLTGLSGSDDGFFGNAVDMELGYRFAGSKTFAEVKATFSSSLSDADADLGVWDIA